MEQLNAFMMASRSMPVPFAAREIEPFSLIWGRFKEAGWRSFAHAGYSGALSSFGLTVRPGSWKPLPFGGGKMAAFRGYGGFLASFGVGYAVGSFTGDPLLGVGAGMATSMAFGLGGSYWTRFGIPMFAMGASIISGYQQGGIGGAIKGAVHTGLEFALWDVGAHAVKTAFGAESVAEAIGVSSFGLGLALPLATVALAGYAAYRGAQYLYQRGKEAKMSEWLGNMMPFLTKNALTMRQRALQEIARSHVNARSVFGNEAQLMHFA